MGGVGEGGEQVVGEVVGEEGILMDLDEYRQCELIDEGPRLAT